MHPVIAWYLEQMRGLVPGRTEARLPDALVVAPEGEGIAIWRRRGGGTHLVGRGAPAAAGRLAAVTGRSERVWLRVDPAFLLEKELTLPLAAERDLRQVLRFELDRETPFSAEEVWWSAVILRRDRAHGRLTVRLSMVPRLAVAGLLADLGASGLVPSMLEVPVPGEAPRLIALAGIDRARILARPLGRAVAGVAALALLTLIAPFLRQSLEMAGVERRIAALEPDAAEAAALRRQVLGSGAGAQAVAAERTRLGDVLTALAETSRALPDDTHLSDFTLKERHLSLIGQSAGAAQLIGRLAQDPVFRNPAFSAPVTRLELTHQDLFSISAEVAP